MRGKQLIQMLQVLEALSRQCGVTLRELQETLEVSRRTVERILSTMQQLHFPIYDEIEEGEKEKHWHLEESFTKKLPNLTVPNLNLTLSEVISLYFIRWDDPIMRGTRIERWINSIFTKLGLLFPEEIKPAMDRIRKLRVTKNSAAKAYVRHENTLKQIVNAMLNQETIRLTYNSFSNNRKSDFETNPLHIFEDSGGLYLIAQRLHDSEIRTMAIERIQKINKTSREYEYPDSFCPETHLNSTFGIIDDGPISVKILFSNSQAKYITERIWVEGQTIDTNSDGSVIISFSTRGKWDVKKWILGWGPAAKVLEPRELAEEIRHDIEKMLKNYP